MAVPPHRPYRVGTPDGCTDHQFVPIAVCETFYTKRALLQVPPLIRGDFAPDGLREVLARTKAYTKDLRERGVCPKCPGDNKNLRCPSADFCEICCFKEALGLRGKPPR